MNSKERKKDRNLIGASVATVILAASALVLSTLPVLACWDYYAYLIGSDMVPPTTSRVLLPLSYWALD
jgi:hypothetical protein